MKVIFSSSDIISISLLKSVLYRNDIAFYCFDENINCMHGGINAFPIRMAVLDRDLDDALMIVNDLFGK